MTGHAELSRAAASLIRALDIIARDLYAKASSHDPLQVASMLNGFGHRVSDARDDLRRASEAGPSNPNPCPLCDRAACPRWTAPDPEGDDELFSAERAKADADCQRHALTIEQWRARALKAEASEATCVCSPGFVVGAIIHADSCPMRPHAADAHSKHDPPPLADIMASVDVCDAIDNADARQLVAEIRRLRGGSLTAQEAVTVDRGRIDNARRYARDASEQFGAALTHDDEATRRASAEHAVKLLGDAARAARA